MKNPISWDPSLVKKFSTSNHYKLLNQLRNEVKKYPLNKKKKISSSQNTDTNVDNINKTHESLSQNNYSSNTFNHFNEVKNNNVNVSFNNSKNFSIYSKTNYKSNQINETIVSDQSNFSEDPSSKNFKDRLDQIDMK